MYIMSTNFIRQDFINDIYQNVVVRTFPLLQESHKRILLDYLINLLNLIVYSFNFDLDNSVIYEHQFRQNNYQDVVALLLLLVPYINDDTNTKKQTIKSLNDIFVAKKDPNVDLNKESPEYIYSNLQYNRCIRNPGNIVEREYKRDYLDHNYYLLLNTIRTISNKLYVNWIDVLPYDLTTYKYQKLYIDTVDKFNNGTLDDWNFVTEPISRGEPISRDETIEKLRGLPINDIYDTISNELYINIKRVKWVIFDVIPSYPETRQPIPMLIACSYLFDLTMAINNFNWKSLTDNLRKLFTDQWQEFLMLTFNNYDYVGDKIKLDNGSLQKIARSLLYAFDRDYRGKRNAIENHEYVPFNSKETEYDMDEIEDLTGSITNAERNSLESLKPEHMYTFITDSIQKFKQTWYYRYVFNQKTQTINKIGEFSLLDAEQIIVGRTITLTLKNIYNFAKSLVNYETRVDNQNKYIGFPRFWKSLNSDERSIILDRLNNKTPITNWFNIRGYIRRTYEIMYQERAERENLEFINDEIYKLIRRNIIRIIFESMITRGVLSYFKPNREITDESVIRYNRYSTIAEILSRTTLNKNNIIWTQSYYYLTGTPYSQLERFSLEGSNKIVDYFEYNTRDHWFSFYALNWISQINFFHKYLNNRVIFVTGSTGVGKSTQVPKLFLYALKCIDYKNDGSVACTQPRRAPTENNAKQVSSQLGFPVYEGKYYYVQFRHKNTNYTRDVDHLSLKFITDGSLLQEIQYPLLKNTWIGSSTDKINYSQYNQYDIVIVDEAHEHNKNMDLILTLMKFCTYYNNDIKLAIVSATMDDDEPIYRRFYRDVNDNRMFPLNSMIQENKLDRINVDRRFHISPPGQTTKYKITEYYVPNENPISLILRIINQDPNGFILYFEPGIAEINKRVTELNQVLPPGVIAVPFHSKLNQYQRQFIENIDKQFQNIHIDRNLPFNEFSLETNSRGTSNYNRVVIVATNIAEASLTITNLRYVIDTGTQKIALFDYKDGGVALVEKPISDSSRLQRRGRVGRTAPGTVYYLYPKGTTEGIESQYDIAISNIYLELYDLLRNTYRENPIFNEYNDPNSKKFRISTVDESNSLSKIIKNQYFENNLIQISNQFNVVNQFYQYIGNFDHYDYQYSDSQYSKLPYVYPDGFSLNTLTDSEGKFYIIHPEELGIRRNIIGEITGLINDFETHDDDIKYHNNRIHSAKMESFWNTLLSNLFMSGYLLNGTECVEKTVFGKGVSLLKQQLGSISIEEFDVRFVYALLYGISLGVSESIIRLVSVYATTMNDFINRAITGYLVNGKFRRNIDNVLNFVGKQKSDSDAVLFILNDFHRMLENNGIILNQNNIEHVNKLAKLKYDFVHNPESLDIETKISLRKIIESGKVQYSDRLSNEDFVALKTDNVSLDVLFKSINNKMPLIETWASNRSIKLDVLMDYLKRYMTLQNILSNDEIRGSKKSLKISDLVNLLKQVTTNDVPDDDKITLSLLYGFKNNVLKFITRYYYLSIYEPSINNIYTLSRIAPHILNTLVDTKYLHNYTMYINENSEENVVTGLHYIKTSLFKYIGYSLSRDSVYNKYLRFENQKINIDPKNKLISPVAGKYKKILKETMNDLIASHDTNIWYELLPIFNDKYYLQIRKFHDINYATVKEFSLFVPESNF